MHSLRVLPLSVNVPQPVRQLDRFLRVDRIVNRINGRSMQYPYMGAFTMKWAKNVTKDFLRAVRQIMSQKGYNYRTMTVDGNGDEVDVEYYRRDSKEVVLTLRISADGLWLFDVYKDGIPLPLMVMQHEYKNTPSQGVAPSMVKPGFNGRLTPNEGRRYLQNWRHILHWIDHHL